MSQEKVCGADDDTVGDVSLVNEVKESRHRESGDGDVLVFIEVLRMCLQCVFGEECGAVIGHHGGVDGDVTKLDPLGG